MFNLDAETAQLMQEGASSLLASPAVNRLFVDMENYLISNWREANEPEVREKIWYNVRALDDLRTLLQVFASDLKRPRDIDEAIDELP